LQREARQYKCGRRGRTERARRVLDDARRVVNGIEQGNVQRAGVGLNLHSRLCRLGIRVYDLEKTRGKGDAYIDAIDLLAVGLDLDS
jgi:hypothetical protein